MSLQELNHPPNIEGDEGLLKSMFFMQRPGVGVKILGGTHPIRPTL